MSSNMQNLRKAAVFLRSLDADTAARLLAQLSPDEAQQLRAAARTLGSLDPIEQAEVSAEFHRAKTPGGRTAPKGVELEISSAAASGVAEFGEPPVAQKRFEFLEHAPVEALVRFLSREHVQTIAVVLSYLPPRRAAAVVAALPAALQAEAIERLSQLGDTDPDSLTVLERELSDWLAHRSNGRHSAAGRGDAALAILAASDVATRNEIMANLAARKAQLAKQLSPLLPTQPPRDDGRTLAAGRRNIQAEALETGEWKSRTNGSDTSPPGAQHSLPPGPQPISPRLDIQFPRPAAPAPRFDFDDLLVLSAAELAAVLRDVHPSVLVLALVGSSDELIDRICEQLPKRAGKAFRRQLGRIGPTRLSDVEAAQRLIASVAGRHAAVHSSCADSTTSSSHATAT